MFCPYIGKGISFSFREGKYYHYNTLSSKKFIHFVMDTTLNVKVYLEIPTTKRIGAVVLVAYVIFYNCKEVVY